ncbi:hypothetical protein EBO15_31185 [Actinomadura harenae]|uniref:Uncharacterized protein n=1 Tax=Actinomadura harenae TaxID=2483351 RepID=A0A3M2LNC0_9ACTN|nr:hypothetical protein EBO15_31185 [Actinomadura harenae]
MSSLWYSSWQADSDVAESARTSRHFREATAVYFIARKTFGRHGGIADDASVLWRSEASA